MKNLFKGTNKEWEVDKESGINRNEYGTKFLSVMFQKGMMEDCVDVFITASDCEKELYANAELISAAPELLAFTIEMVKRYPNSPWITEQGQKAINKALGNEN